MRQFGRWLISSCVWLAWALVVILWTPIVLLVFLLTAWWDRRRLLVGRLFRGAAKLAVVINPLWRVSISGHMPRPADHPFVGVCNHESLADIMLVGSLPWEMKWLSKQSNLRLPFLGWMMRLAGDVGVSRGDPDSRRIAFDRLASWLGRGVSIMIFPEGTRSRTAELLPFRSGAFRVAIQNQVPILPMAVSGTRGSLGPKSMLIGSARISVRILEPVPVSGLTDADVESLRDHVRDLIAAARQLP